jgi:hypothetical protein
MAKTLADSVVQAGPERVAQPTGPAVSMPEFTELPTDTPKEPTGAKPAKLPNALIKASHPVVAHATSEATALPPAAPPDGTTPVNDSSAVLEPAASAAPSGSEMPTTAAPISVVSPTGAAPTVLSSPPLQYPCPQIRHHGLYVFMPAPGPQAGADSSTMTPPAASEKTSSLPLEAPARLPDGSVVQTAGQPTPAPAPQPVTELPAKAPVAAAEKKPSLDVAAPVEKNQSASQPAPVSVPQMLPDSAPKAPVASSEKKPALKAPGEPGPKVQALDGSVVTDLIPSQPTPAVGPTLPADPSAKAPPASAEKKPALQPQREPGPKVQALDGSVVTDLIPSQPMPESASAPASGKQPAPAVLRVPAINPATLPKSTASAPVASQRRADLFVGPLLPQDESTVLTAGATQVKLPDVAAAPSPTPGATKTPPSPPDDSWHLGSGCCLGLCGGCRDLCHSCRECCDRCGEHCRDLWGECCNWGAREPIVVANVDLDFLKPYWKTNPAFVVGTMAGPVPTVHVTDFDYSMQVVPQFTLGVMGHDEIGVRFGWWGFAAQSSDFTSVGAGAIATSAAPLGILVPAVATQGLAASSKFRFDVWDFEAFEIFHPCNLSLLVSGGVRYAHISQNYNAFAVDAAGLQLESVLSGHNFNGAGPTVSVTGKHGLGESNFYIYGNARGSVLFGQGKQTASCLLAGIDFADVNNSWNDVLPELEFEVGLGWYRALGQARVFAQAGLVGQAWFEAGNSSRSDLSGVLGSFSVGSQTDGTLGLLGLSVRVGVNY